ncbi:DUF6933 domain-containing protein [Bacillus sp. T3]|uniref:DUF6933 domain-containing protein n=1 Tax=Bacillus sp. T3 TaxID=467262 RepID=UPI0039914A14
MIIHCTKKLLDQLQVKPVSDVENEDIYSWHANLLMINRKKIVVLVNNQNRYTIKICPLQYAMGFSLSAERGSEYHYSEPLFRLFYS